MSGKKKSDHITFFFIAYEIDYSKAKAQAVQMQFNSQCFVYVKLLNIIKTQNLQNFFHFKFSSNVFIIYVWHLSTVFYRLFTDATCIASYLFTLFIVCLFITNSIIIIIIIPLQKNRVQVYPSYGTVYL